jgi:hypothetical protein
VTIEYNSKAGRKEALALARELHCDAVGASLGGGRFSAKSGRVRLVAPAAALVSGDVTSRLAAAIALQ